MCVAKLTGKLKLRSCQIPGLFLGACTTPRLMYYVCRFLFISTDAVYMPSHVRGNSTEPDLCDKMSSCSDGFSLNQAIQCNNSICAPTC